MVTPLVVIALIMAFGTLGVVIVDTIVAMQEAEAKSITGTCASTLRNASASLCPKGPP
jgi:hypothetical protein